MLASINPFGERARNTTWRRTVVWYVAGSTAGGAAAGAAAGLVGVGLHALLAPSPAAVAIAAAAVCAVGVLLDLGAGGVTLPTPRRQVDENWLARYRGWVYGGGFGFQLGVGVMTIVTTATVYVALLLAVLAGSLPGGVAVGATFGFVRALPILAVARAHDPGRLRAVLRRAHALAGPARTAAVATLVLVAVTSVLVAVA
jgi:hypothetical protein